MDHDLGEAQDREELRRLEESLWRSESRFDPQWMRQVMAPDFVEFGRSGRRYDFSDIVANETLGDGSREFDARIPLPEYELHFVAPDVALATYLSDLTTPGGRQHARRSSLWQRRPRGWQLRFHQGTPLR